MSLLVDFVSDILWQPFLENLLHGTGRRVIRAISLGRIRIPPLHSSERSWAGATSAFVAGALFWILVLCGAVFAVWSAVS